MKLWRAVLRLVVNEDGEFGDYKMEFYFKCMEGDWVRVETSQGYKYQIPSKYVISPLDCLTSTVYIHKQFLDSYIVTQAFEHELSEQELAKVKREMVHELLNYIDKEYETVARIYSGKKSALNEELHSLTFDTATAWEPCNIDECALCGSEEASDYFICEECGCKCCEHCGGDDSLCLECVDKYATCDFCGRRESDYSVCPNCGETMCWHCTGEKTGVLCVVCEDIGADL